jgi:lysophospholipase L1-like esterase
VTTRVNLRPQRQRRGRAVYPVLALLLVLAVGTSTAAVRKAESRVGLRASAVAVEPSATARPVTSLWFGDSIVEGCCRSSSGVPTMATVAAQRLGWAPPQIAAAGGTGYTTQRVLEGVRSGTYVERIAAAVEGSYYDVVVVAGGNNDDTAAFDPAQFRAAVRTVLDEVRTNLPEAQLVVLGPYSPDGTGYQAQRTIEQEEAARVGAVFVDQVAEGWMRGRRGLLNSDGFHPNDAGHAHLGGRAAAALSRALPADLTAPSGVADEVA